ncbi:MAG TPA: apolipoprotein N-acyltransferase, partial [Thermoanaerobaculia bacterium]|nr:apolipoprotein N-acyltransferase [Thermoanaerobaculia bacterium]
MALIPLMAAVDGAPVRRALSLGWLFGFVFWAATVPWIAYTVRTFGGVPWAVALLALGITAGVYAVPMGLMAAAVAVVAPRSGAATILTWGAAWVAQETFRSTVFVFGGFPWVLLGSALADHPVLVQGAALGGVHLVSFLVAALNATLLVAMTRRSRPGRLLVLAGAAAVAVAVVVLGGRRLGRLPEGETVVRVGVVQPNVPQLVRWEAGTAVRQYADLAEQTRRLVARDRPDVVLWPESASPFSWPWDAGYRESLTGLSRELGVALLVNTVWSDAPSRPDAPYYNAALLVTPDGPVLPPYEKQRLVPFGEYVPLAGLLRFVGPISRAVPGAFTPADRGELVRLGSVRLGGAVCYEVVYPWIAREHVRAGADVLFTLTNDAWYGRAGARHQHWQGAVLRAVETGRPLVRAAITGISGAVDPAGRVLVTIGPDRKGSFAVPLPAPLPAPPAVALGDAVSWVCAAGLAAA